MKSFGLKLNVLALRRPPVREGAACLHVLALLLRHTPAQWLHVRVYSVSLPSKRIIAAMRQILRGASP